MDFPDFDGVLDQVIDRALQAGVHRMVTICTRLRNEPIVRAIAEAADPEEAKRLCEAAGQVITSAT